MPNRSSYLVRPIVAALLVAACARAEAPIEPDPLGATDIITERVVNGERAGIAIRGAGGFAAYERLTAVDSATGRFLTVIRQRCIARPCTAPLDSAVGVLQRDEVQALFALAADESIAALAGDQGTCSGCADQLFYTVTVQANGTRAAVHADSETMPDGLRRFQAAIAETIREARAAR